ncbi:MAG TPA: hypothetical protein VGH04_07895 [Gemmatimonadaceae bacterium]|jgi:hypothetical protein
MRRFHIVHIVTATLVASTAYAGVAQAQGDQGRGRGRGQQQSDDRDKRVKDEQRRTDDYRAHLEQQTRVAEQQAAQLQQAKRTAQYRVQQDYATQLDRQREQLRAERRYDNEPYVATAPTYRYQFNGAYHETNQYGVDMLRQAVNTGYQRGYQAGAADRQDHWRFDYQNSPVYREATLGYSGSYVDLGDYSYYFRQGFSRGYQDGYYSRLQYGSGSNGAASILANVVAGILHLSPIR